MLETQDDESDTTAYGKKNEAIDVLVDKGDLEKISVDKIPDVVGNSCIWMNV